MSDPLVDLRVDKEGHSGDEGEHSAIQLRKLLFFIYAEVQRPYEFRQIESQVRAEQTRLRPALPIQQSKRRGKEYDNRAQNFETRGIEG